MDWPTRNRIIKKATERRLGIADEKGVEYTQSEGALENFYRNAKRVGSDPVTILYVYLGKHQDSIESFVKKVRDYFTHGDGDKMIIQMEARAGEGIRSRLDDIRNYYDLLECLLVEEGIIDEDKDE
jgi:hypothetical protein